MSGETTPKALIVGIADGLGTALATAFADAGYDVIGLARSDRVAQDVTDAVSHHGRSYAHLVGDVTDADTLAAALRPHAEDVSIAVYNAHELLIRPFAETATEDFERVWRVNCYGAMALARTVVGPMSRHGSGTLIFTGATASIKGGGRFAAFASGKFALRGLAQSLAREYGPKGVHVCHTIIDGLIDETQTEARFGVANAGEDTRMAPDAIARLYLELTNQPRSAWTHEVDLRPFSESF